MWMAIHYNPLHPTTTPLHLQFIPLQSFAYKMDQKDVSIQTDRYTEERKRNEEEEREEIIERVIFLILLFQIINESTTAASRTYSCHTNCIGTS